MLIRNQDKTIIINLDSASCIFVRDDTKEEGKNRFRICSSAGEWPGGFIPLGEYSTKEKVMKVMDRIQEVYSAHYYSEGGVMATANFYVPAFAFIPPKVFEMPVDEDVEV